MFCSEEFGFRFNVPDYFAGKLVETPRRSDGWRVDSSLPDGIFAELAYFHEATNWSATQLVDSKAEMYLEVARYPRAEVGIDSWGTNTYSPAEGKLKYDFGTGEFEDYQMIDDYKVYYGNLRSGGNDDVKIASESFLFEKDNSLFRVAYRGVETLDSSQRDALDDAVRESSEFAEADGMISSLRITE